MCTGNYCVFLGADPDTFDTHSPLRPLPWFDGSLDHFSQAVSAAAKGQLDRARTQLALTGDDALQEYFEHAHVSGGKRWRLRGRPAGEPRSAAPVGDGNLGAWESVLFARDGYHCRYCGCRVIPDAVLRAFGNLMGDADFPLGTRGVGRHLGRHGVILVFRATLDHVTPRHLGGATNRRNLVTACWACNYGKRRLTLHQLGLRDPRRTPARRDEWAGLTEHVEALVQQRLQPK